MTKSAVETIFDNVTARRDHRRRIAQMVYDAYEFDRKVESGSPDTAWFSTFDQDTPVMARKLVVFGGEGAEPVTGWFKVEFDKGGTTVTDAYAYVGKRDIFGTLPAGFLNNVGADAEQDDRPSTGWKM